MQEDMTIVTVEHPSYWRDYFANLNKNPLGLAVWRGIFDDTELSEFITLPGESIEDATLRHQRKLIAMLEALEEIQPPELEWLITRLRQQLKL
jgi:hypothetical protein